MSTASESLFATIQSAFQRMGWKGQRLPEKEVYEADFETHHTKARVHAQAFPAINAISVSATTSHRIPAARAGLIAEMLMRTNHELIIGAFELDYETGSVLFRATNIFPPHRTDERIIASLVHSALAEIDRLTPFVTILLKMSVEELSKLNLKLFLKREDLLPPVPEHPTEHS